MSSAAPAPGSTDSIRVVAVIVAYNRSELLREAIEALLGQERAVQAIVVVDNASTDDTAAVVASFGASVDLVSLDRNTGGAGGFAVGMARALRHHSPDWLWIMDDDTVPTSTALGALVAAVDGSDVVVAGSRVVWTDGQDHPMNTPRRKPFVSAVENEQAAARGTLPVRSTSFVSMFARADVVREVGLPIADYFIWNDDFEYSTRLLRGRRGVFAPGSVVVHKTKILGSTDIDPGPRFYYEVRNKLWMLRHSRSLSRSEKLLYGASSIRRWIRTAAKSSDRSVLRDGFRRGWRDGFSTRPRANGDALAGFAEASADVVAVERTSA
ncbi:MULTISPECIES: glycosyltransferase family 2 protein [unclassified Leifsonia]|uniref:glycosyltransferase family 2 protein n=1 Tax=unclassified Leifsonia TaxID=2663824 RepID=UPI0006FBC1E5|nr:MULTISPECIES: glycosyltransferase family 2 protein [unclassified Leifsonia]KQX06376.1 glycosyl transferase [Leifsonia sp. Root1293]KRA10660.1 glycosyl transferase [Leifsonia sp. Root60]